LRPRPRILLVDDHAGILEAASKLLVSEFDVVGTARDGREAVSAAMRLAPDLIVMDIMMPEMDGFGAAQELRRRGSRAKIVFMTLQWDDGYLAAARESGGFAYVLKAKMNSDLVPAVSEALAAEGTISSLAV
jgi:CheY-like chemotaxis protein